MTDGQPGGNKGVCRNDHLIPRADAQPTQNQLQGIQAIAATHGTGNATKGREFLFKGACLRTTDKKARINDRIERLFQFISQRFQFALQALERHLHFSAARKSV